MISGVPIGGGVGFTACRQRSEKVLLPGDVVVAAITPANGSSSAKTLSNGVGEEHAYAPKYDRGCSYPGPPCTFHSAHPPFHMEGLVNVNGHEAEVFHDHS